MVTLRMVLLAVAILLGAPVGWVVADHAIGHIQTNGGELVNFALEEAATVTDIVLVEPPPRYDRLPIHDYHEQLVEGHTVFITIDIPLVRNVTNFTVDVVGNVSCETHFSGEGEFFGPLPIPRRINEAHEECRAAGFVFVTPDPFLDSQRGMSSQSPLRETGRTIPFTAPSGESGEAVEYAFDVFTTDWLGETTTVQRMYAWRVPVLEPWMHSDGRPKSFYCPIPEDRLLEMDVRDFRAYHQSEMDETLFAQ